MKNSMSTAVMRAWPRRDACGNPMPRYNSTWLGLPWSVGPFPVSEAGNHYILIALDYFTNWPEAYAVPNQSAVTTAEKLLEMFRLFRAPD